MDYQDKRPGRFIGGVAALVWSPEKNKYLLLKRAKDKDFASEMWECVTGRVDQGEGFEDAVRREVQEELGVDVQIEFLIGTTHFYRGPEKPENELIGVVYCCSLEDHTLIRLSPEHSEMRWVDAQEAQGLLTDPAPPIQWIRRVIERAEKIRHHISQSLQQLYREEGFEFG